MANIQEKWRIFNNTQHPNLIEFQRKVKYDGVIVIIDGNTIVKIKDYRLLSVDLQYDEKNNIFLDRELNVYNKI